ncbi:uncharacterized protein B0J16DRAFT_388458 [Fusarium flagelliforme]|uniref:Uncharacterized protein n=1 Tax=Fusarium flagelliforme TaxID=2675880 RepID=A0A395MK61_9HYPO|nr:uncharacterized protein B0J16DRAFT_388458 [Fusarium flagelliforme]KAH7174635.1 hypothetical protein B0J16DRAFT_388458 [Fusarium flagelliforme]RFN48328.1 hypothetical protein FIE12Z_7377 [Fusarium flagelliforme]
MTDAAPVAPAPSNQADRNYSRNTVQKCFRRIYLVAEVWPWEWLPPEFTPRPEDWNYANAEAMASVVELVCQPGSSVSLNDLRHFLVGLCNKRKQRNGLESCHATALTADCHLARKWTPPFDHNEENCDYEAEFDRSIENIHQDLESSVHNSLVGFEEGLLRPDNSRRVKDSPAPELPQLKARKRTRLALGPDDGLDTELQEAFSSPDLDTDFEMSRIESSRRISINRQISILQERITGTESVRKMCLKEKEEKRRVLERIGEHRLQGIHDEAIRVHNLAADRLEKAERFAEGILSAIVEYGEEGPQTHDVLGHSQEEVMKADKAKEAAQGVLKSLKNDLRVKKEQRAEVRDRITTLQMAIDDYDRDIAKDEREKQELLIKLASLDILCSRDLHTVPIEKRDVLLSALHDVLEHAAVCQKHRP